MPMNKTVSIINADTIELHYWLKDGSHTMDAHIFNKCERELLGIIDEFATKLKIQVEIEVQPLGEGGLLSWLKLSGRDKNSLKITILAFVITDVFLQPITSSVDFLVKQAWERYFENPEIRALKEEKEKAELIRDIFQIKAELEKFSASIDENKFKKKRSNYFESASKCKKLNKISISILDTSMGKEYGSSEVIYDEFEKFILKSDELDPIIDEDATIEIISPVLKKGKYQWLGIYHNDVIQFRMISKEFKAMVLTGQIPFKNGSSIKCMLEVCRKIDNQGNEKITGYIVHEVYGFFNNDIPIETPAGRRKRRKNRATVPKQLYLFKDEDYE